MRQSDCPSKRPAALQPEGCACPARKARARVIAALRPRRLLMTTLGLGLGVLVAQVASLVAFFLGFPVPDIPHGALFLPLLLVHGVRWALIRQGWSPVLADELALLPYVLDRQAAWANGDLVELQADLAQRVNTLGWLNWADVAACARARGLGPLSPDWFFLVGGMGSGVAGRREWRQALDSMAWRHALLDRNLPAADVPVRAAAACRL